VAEAPSRVAGQARDTARRDNAAVGPAAAWRVIRSRNFGPYFVGNATSASGTWFQNLAASILVYRLTHSAFLLGVLNFGQFIPVLVLSPWAGSVADRFDRRVVALVTQVIAAGLSLILAALAFTHHVDEWTVIGFTLAVGVTSAFSAPAQLALIASLVDEEDVPQAVALNSMTFNLARAIGPATAAAVIAVLGIPWAFLLNSFSYLILVVGLLVVHPRPQERPERASLREGFRLVRDDRRLLAYLAIVAVVGFASDPINTESPAFAHAFGYDPAWAGALIGVFGAGAVTAAFLVAGRVAGSRERTVRTLLLMAVSVIAYCLTPWMLLAFVPLFTAGFGYLSSNTAATTRLQLGVAEVYRGRIMALWSIAFLGLRPFASIVDGALAAAFGVRVAGIVLALPALVLALLIYRTIRR
jgi:predicted MFS family arabinose efflux permease